MKKLSGILLVLAVMTVGTSALAGRYVWEGQGTNVVATTTPQFIQIVDTNYCYAVSTINLDSSNNAFWKKVYYDEDMTTLIATNGWVAGAGMCTPTENSYTSSGGTMMNEEKSRAIGGVVIATTNGTAEVFINWE